MNISKTHWKLINIAGLLLLSIVVIDPYDIHLLFEDTILTGGDAGSWYQVAQHLKESLLPNWRFFGWDQGNFFGYSNLQHYFVLPFLIIVLLSYFIPLTIALKIITIISFFALPFLVYWSLRKLKFSPPIPLAGAWLVLAFLFHERYSMFGGNLLSNLAGEFCYSFAFALLVIYQTFIIIDFKEEKLSLRSGILLGLIGLSHAFVFFIAVLMPLFFLFAKPNQKTIQNLIVVYGFGFLIMAFWVLPMLSNLYYTTPIELNWRFPLPMELLQTIHWQTMLVALAFVILLLFKPFRSYEGNLYIYMVICSVLLYFIASSLRIPDIRFFPPILFYCLMLILNGGAIIINKIDVHKDRASLSMLGICILLGGGYVYDKNNVGPDWFNSNYSGYENQSAFIDGRADSLFNSLKGDYNDPRVAWEQGRHDIGFGTMRVFENIPLFTGRATTEGIHYASGLLSLPITILNSEYSKTPGSPSPNIYSHYFIDSIDTRFKMLNIRDFIAYSPEISKLINETDKFKIINKAFPYTVYQLTNFDSQYIETPKYTPLLTEDLADWKFRFNNWFRRGDTLDITLVNGYLASDASKQYQFNSKTVKLDFSGRLKDLKKTPVEQANITDINITNFRISFETDKPGTPHIIKIAYSPLWQSESEEEIFMVAPGFMLLYPETKHVVLRYTRDWVEYLGLVLSSCGIFLAIIFGINKNILEKLLDRKPISRSIQFLLSIRKPVMLFIAIIIIFLGFLSYSKKHAIYSDYIAGLKALERNKLELAIDHLEKNTGLDKISTLDNADIPASIYALGRAYRIKGDNLNARKAFMKLTEFYPRWIFIDEIYWHLGDIAREENDFTEAKAMFEECLAIAKFGDYHKKCKTDLSSLTNALKINSNE